MSPACPTCGTHCTTILRRHMMVDIYQPCGHPFHADDLQKGELLQALPAWWVQRHWNAGGAGDHTTSLGLFYDKAEADKEVARCWAGSDTKDVTCTAIVVSWNVVA